MELEVSIDGKEKYYNHNRVAVDRSVNPYPTLLENIEHLKRYDLNYNAVLVFTPDTFPHLRENLEYVLALGFERVSINYAIGYHWEPELLERYADLIVDFVDRFEVLNHGDDFFIKNLRHKCEPTVLNSELVVDTDGSLHLLSEWQFKKNYRMREGSLRYDLDEIESIDDVFFTRSQVYHLVYEIYRSEDRDILSIVHNNVDAGLRVQRLLRARLGSRLG